MLPALFPDRPEMRVAVETIYQALYARGPDRLHRAGVRLLRTGRVHRRRRRRSGERTGRFVAPMVMIDQRPPEVADRLIAGHWEGDLITGSAIDTSASPAEAVGLSPTPRLDPFTKVGLAHLAARDGADDVVGLVRVAGCWQPRSAVAVYELDCGQECTTLVTVRQRMVLHQVPAEDGGLGLEVWVPLDAAKAGLGRGQRRLGQSDSIEVGDRLGREPEHALRDEQVIRELEIFGQRARRSRISLLRSMLACRRFWKSASRRRASM